MSPKILALKHAIPYLAKYRGKLFVIKIGGSHFDDSDGLRHICEEIAALFHVGIKVLLVHGGGPQIQKMCERLGIQQKVVAGRRITTAETLEVAKMIFAGKLNTELASILSSFDVPVTGLTGLDGPTLIATRRPPVQIRDRVDAPEEQVDFGFVGDITRIEPSLVQHLLQGGYVPIVCSLAADEKRNVLNVNADGVASHLAVALGAEKYVNVSSTPGLLRDLKDPQSVVSYVDIQGLESMKRDGLISGGMLPKVESCIAALQGGVNRAHIIQGGESDSLLTEIFTNEGCGTMIVPSKEKNGNGAGAWL